MKKLLVVLSLVISNSIATASEEKQQAQYYLQLYSGEHKTQNYQGPINNLMKFNANLGQLVFLDETYYENFLDDKLQADLFHLEDFWYKKINDQSACPNVNLNENIDYIRYLYRLTTMSYLFESIRINHRVNIQLGGDKKACMISYENIFGSCIPKTDEMKKFKERVQGKFANEISKISYEPLSKSEINSWLKLFKRSNAETLDPTFSRLHRGCNTSEKDCEKLSLTEIKNTVSDFCEQDLNLVKKICNETDELYGMSTIPLAAELVKNSSAFNLVNTEGIGENCLRRYNQIFSTKENHYYSLGQLYSTIHSYLQNEHSRYLQGDLFLPGALKEFDNKGLSDFLTALKPPAPLIVAVAKPIPKPIVAKKVEVKKVEVKPVVVAKIDPAPVVVIAQPEIHISEFESAVARLQKENLERLAIDMDIFQSDFEFTTKLISELSIPLRKFQTRAALKEMKTFDKLGAKEAPLGLRFIKFLIDTENHQGLYNVVAELGNTFYVYNDLEFLTVPVYIELKNDSSTHNRWQLTILRPQKNTEALKK
jgi:hypothetical protein